MSLWRRVVPVVFVLALAAPLAAQQKLAVKAARAVTVAGADVPNPVMLIDGDVIRSIATAQEIPEGYVVVDLGDAVLMPGLVDARSRAGAPNDLVEDAEAIDRSSRAIEAVDVAHRDWGLLRRAGVTTVGIGPEFRNVVSGVGAILGTGKERAAVMREDGPVWMALDESVLDTRRAPTSYLEARRLLEATLTRAKAGDDAPALVELTAGRRRGIAWARSAKALADLIGFAREMELPLAIAGADRIRDLDGIVDLKGFPVLLAPLAVDAAPRDLALPAWLEGQGVELGFYAETPKNAADVLRWSAALAARNGLSRRAALAAITLVPARALGVDDRVGSLEAGKDASFLVLDGDPLSLASALQEVWIEGKRVHRAPRENRSSR